MAACEIAYENTANTPVSKIFFINFANLLNNLYLGHDLTIVLIVPFHIIPCSEVATTAMTSSIITTTIITTRKGCI